MTTTTDISAFGYRERDILIKLLTAWQEKGLPIDFYDDKVIPMMNYNSGHVFLTNSEFQVAMLNLGKLESFYSCGECGAEGFWDDFKNHSKNRECKEVISQTKKGRGK